MEGILLVDKDKGSSSFKVVSKVRRALGTKAVGHVGTLDPLASGLLVLLIGRYTRLSNYLMAGRKKYLAMVELGSSTNTDDKEGEVLEKADASHIRLEEIQRVLTSFLGKQKQIPPIYSAISVGGVRSYQRARSGEVFELDERDIEIYQIVLSSYQERTLAIEVTCSKGTYIRSLARDIGKRLGVPAHLAGLRRTNCSGYDVADAICESELSDAILTQGKLMTKASDIKGLDLESIDNDVAAALKQGKKVRTCWNRSQNQDQIFLAVQNEEPIALCEISDGYLKSVRGFG